MASLTVTKLNVYAVLDSSPTERVAAATKLNVYAVLDSSPGETVAAATKLNVYAVIENLQVSPFYPEPVFFPGAGPGVFGGARFQPLYAYPINSARRKRRGLIVI